METMMRISVLGLAAAGLLLCGSTGALAHNPVTLTDGQLDIVTAGSAVVIGASSDAQAMGALSLTQTTGDTFAVQGASPYPGQPDLGPSAGVAEGTAVAQGNSLGSKWPASTSTNVTTVGAVGGNQMFNFTRNLTIYGGGGVQIQFGLTFVYGAWVGL
jgi:hypothetical protein